MYVLRWSVPDSPFKPHYFEREDPSPDPEFYVSPRLVVHIDEHAIAAARRLYGELISEGSAVLDVMSSFRSHLPEDRSLSRVAGLGLNASEMRENPQLSEFVVHDLNADPTLPFGSGEFDAAVMTVSVQYLIQPIEVFREVARVMKPGAPFVVTYSNRMFPTKAVRIWRALDDRERATLIGAYFKYAGVYGETTAEDRTVDSGSYNDPLFAVWARTRQD
jgi:SAM-dependent methyltransferase